MIIIAYLFFGIGLFFMIFGALGILRFPDLYTRLHPAGKAGTAGILSIFIGLIFYSGFSFNSQRIILITLFILITSPVATHAIARGAMESGIIPWEKKNK
ncbi:MAG: monovalent cation/H(+) antiporter subunit G [Candidatus Margulisbacteria bacterium]|nr:monovalent cation/H(+) antiporter subunit G [Candidatus Margulisiibacteriota bacterium]MBU1021853.1 monovalent cation/H(+) antiporter subunit G [Candidatus Margulisiibacteriota bacterium]MBU1729012.1 monovalent cation/H(+) antiporter subunit G [Candidatus Margulisiibacteriota bacterium]MBU1954435.1 monovalent cation/H(+) antiporter subunit G [Candidatus Margulisiibacteriota bacterium]